MMNPHGKLRFELQIPETAPSPNRYVRAHWSVYQKIKQHWQLLILEAIQESGKPAIPLPRARVSIVRFGKEPLDPDNLHGAQKPLIDALKVNGLIADDSAKHIQLSVEEGQGPKGVAPCTLVEIVALPA